MSCDLTEKAKPSYRPCAGIFLLNAQKKVFVGRRLDTTGDAWQMPQGGIDKGESAIAAGFREMQEEIGTFAAKVSVGSPILFRVQIAK